MKVTGLCAAVSYTHLDVYKRQLDADTDFFMDGGSAVLATSKEKVESNISGVGDILTRENTDVLFLQDCLLYTSRCV